jgi:hypothetical protein
MMRCAGRSGADKCILTSLGKRPDGGATFRASDYMLMIVCDWVDLGVCVSPPSICMCKYLDVSFIKDCMCLYIHVSLPLKMYGQVCVCICMYLIKCVCMCIYVDVSLPSDKVMYIYVYVSIPI